MTRGCTDREEEGKEEEEEEAKGGSNDRERDMKRATKLHLGLVFLTDKY